MKIIICGSNGQVGKEFFDISKKSTHNFYYYNKQELNICKLIELQSIFNKIKPDVVINCIGYTAVDLAEKETVAANSVNADGPLNMAYACKSVGAFMIHLSTDYVFPGDAIDPYCEDDEIGPKSIYGISKLQGERNIKSTLSRHIILRTSWVFGLHGSNFVKTMIDLGREKDSLNIIYDQWGAPTSARGIADCCIKICEKINEDNSFKDWGIYHYSGFPYINWSGFAQIIFDNAAKLKILKKIPKIVPVTSDKFITAANRPLNSKLNCKKIKLVFGIAEDNWEIELKKLIKSI